MSWKCTRTKHQSDVKKRKWSKIWVQITHNGNTEWINAIKKELERHDEGPG